MIKLDKFGGMMPRLAPGLLPEHGAQFAHNVDVRTGALRPFIIPSDAIETNHDANGVLLSGVPAGDVRYIAQPAPVTVKARGFKCKPGFFLRDALEGDGTRFPNAIMGLVWRTYIDPETSYRAKGYYPFPMKYDAEYTETGLVLRAWTDTAAGWKSRYGVTDLLFPASAGWVIGAPANCVSTLTGPNYVFSFENNETFTVDGITYKSGGPLQHVQAPPGAVDVLTGDSDTITPSDAKIAPHHIPLYYDGKCYGHWETQDVAGPDFYEQYAPEFDLYLPIPGFYAEFTVNLHYADPKRRFYYYVASKVTEEGGATIEGPPSELSEEILVRPGEVVELNTPDANRIYRAGAKDAKDFRLLSDELAGTSGATYVDTGEPTGAEEIPPFGNLPGLTAESTPEEKAALLAGSVLHPAHFAITYNANKIRPSDFFRYWAYPDEYEITLPKNVIAQVIVGNGAIVFTDDTDGDGCVYALVGNDPAKLNKYLLSSVGLQNPAGLVRIGDRAYYVTVDGISAAAPSGAEPLLHKLLTREQWSGFEPSQLWLSGADGCLLLEPKGAVITADRGSLVGLTYRMMSVLEPDAPVENPTLPCLRLDPKEDLLTTYKDGANMLWRSRVFRYSGPVCWTYARLSAEYGPVAVPPVAGAADLTLYADGVAQTMYTLTAGQVIRLATTGVLLPAATEWEIEIRPAAGVSVHGLELYEREPQAMDGHIAFTPQNTPCFRNCWARLGAKTRLAALSLSRPNATTAVVDVYADADEAEAAYTLTLGAGETVVRLPYACAKAPTGAALWHFDAHPEEATTLDPVDGLQVYAEQTVWVKDELREKQAGPISPWLYKSYEFEDPALLKTMEVRFHDTTGAETAVDFDMRLVLDGNLTVIASADIAANLVRNELVINGTLVPDLTRCKRVQFDFVKPGEGADGVKAESRDYLVREIVLRGADAIAVNPETGVALEREQIKRSMDFRFLDRGRFAAGLVGADTYSSNLQLKLYVDGETLAWTHNITSGEPFAFPLDAPEGILHRVEIVDNTSDGCGVHLLVLKPWVRQAVEGDRLRLTAQEQRIPPWMYTKYDLPAFRRVSGIEAQVSGACTFRFWKDGGTTPVIEEAIAGADRVWLYDVESTDTGRMASWVQLAFQSAEGASENHLCNEAILHTVAEYPVGPDGLHLRDLTMARGIRCRFQAAGRFAAARVVITGATGSTTLQFYADGVAVGTAITVASALPFRLPRNSASNPVSARWMVDIVTDGLVESLDLMPETVRLFEGETLSAVRSDMFDWLYTRWELPARKTLAGFVVDGNPQHLVVYQDGSQTGYEFNVENGQEQTPSVQNYGELGEPLGNPYNPLTPMRSVEFDFGGEDYMARRVALHFPDETHVDDKVIHLPLDNLRSRPYAFFVPERLGCVQVLASDYSDIALNLIGDGEALGSIAIASAAVTRIPRAAGAHARWVVDLDAGGAGAAITAGQLYPVQTAPLPDVLVERAWGGVPPWMFRRYEAKGRVRLTSLRVVSDTYPVFAHVFPDGAATDADPIQISGTALKRLTDRGGYFEFAFCDANGNSLDTAVHEIEVFSEAPQLAGTEPIRLVNPPSWRGLRYRFAPSGRFACAQVAASDYSNVTLTLYADGVAQTPIEVTGAGIIQFPRDVTAEVWEIDLDAGQAEVESIELYPLRVEPIRGPIALVAQEHGVPAWMFTRWECDMPKTVASVVVTGASVTMRLYADGGAAVPIVLTDGVESAVTLDGVAHSIELDFNEEDSTVRQVQLFFEDPVPIPREGFQLGPRLNWIDLKALAQEMAVFGCARVIASDYANEACTLTLNGTHVHPSSSAVFPLPRTLAMASDWTISAVCTGGAVQQVLLMPKVTVPFDGQVREYGHGDIPPWLFRRYEVQDVQRLTQARVDAASYPVYLQIYADGASAATDTVQIDSGAPVRLDTQGKYFEFAFTDANGDTLDTTVAEVSILAVPVQTMAVEPVNLVAPVAWRGLRYRFEPTGRFACVQISADTYPVGADAILLHVYQNGVELTTGNNAITLASGDVLQLPRTWSAAENWEIDIEAPASTIQGIALYPFRLEQVQGPLIVTEQDTGVAAWKYTRYVFPTPQVLSSGLVVGGNFNLILYADQDVTGEMPVAMVANVEQALSLAAPVRAIEFDLEEA